MKKQAKLFLVIVALVFLSLSHTPLAAEAGTVYDISKYMEWQDGGWVKYLEYDCLDFNCDPFLEPQEITGVEVKRNQNGYRWHYQYRDDGQPGNWILEDRLKYKRTSEYVKWIGIKSDGEMWLFDPVIKIPRALKLKKPFVYNGVARYDDDKIRFTLSLTIAKAGITVSTDAGQFENCIQVERIMSGGPEEGSIVIEIMAPGVGTVKRWDCGLYRAYEGYEEDAFEADTEYHEAIDYGVSNPPFP